MFFYFDYFMYKYLIVICLNSIYFTQILLIIVDYVKKTFYIIISIIVADVCNYKIGILLERADEKCYY
jgi:hypothetical protein